MQAKNSSAFGGLEGNLRFAAASCAGRDEHFALGFSGVLSRVTASLAALRFILEPLLCVEFLFTGGENEFLTALFANQCFVLVHVFYLS